MVMVTCVESLSHLPVGGRGQEERNKGSIKERGRGQELLQVQISRTRERITARSRRRKGVEVNGGVGDVGRRGD